MKLLHLADLHLGKQLCDFDLLEDQRDVLRQILDLIDLHHVDGVLMAGDIYDKPIPSEAAVKVLNEFLTSLSHRKVPTFLISGNHDSDERLGFGSHLFATSGIYITTKYEGHLSYVSLQDEYGEVRVYSLPFLKASSVRHVYPKEKIATYEDAFRCIFSHDTPDPSVRNVILAHQFVAGISSDPKTAGSEGLSVQAVGTVERIGYDVFREFDYTALGHIHTPQQVGRDTIRYAGSLMKYSLSEANADKSLPLITLKEKGNIEVELLPIIPKRDLRHLKGSYKDLLSPEHIISPEDLIYVTLTDEEYLTDAMGLFQQYYPNTLKIDYENTHTRTSAEPEFTTITARKSFPELMSEFYQSIYNTPMSEEELKLILQAAKEEGIYHEAD